MHGERWEPSPSVRAYQSVQMIAPIFAIEGAKAGSSVVGKLLNPHPDDPARLAQNAAWYTQAQAGDAVALRQLGIKGGVLPPEPNNAPWATQTAISDAKAKYLALTAGNGFVASTAAGSDVFASASAFFNNLTKGPSQQIGTAAGTAAAAKAQTTIVMAAIIVGIAIVVAVALKGRR